MKKLLISLAFVFLLLGFSNVLGAECLPDLSNAPCNVTTSLTLDGGIHYINTTGSVIYIAASNIVLDGNGATIIGNGIGYGIYMGNKQNITIKDITIDNYKYNIHQIMGYDINILDYTSYNSERAISITGSVKPENILIENASIYNMNKYGVYVENANNISILNSNFYNSSRDFIRFGEKMSYNIVISNNSFNKSGTQNYPIPDGYSIQLLTAENYTISNNIFYNDTGFGSIRASYGNGEIYQNSFNYNDRAIYFQGNGSNIDIFNNIFNNSWYDYDRDDTSIEFVGNQTDPTWRWRNVNIYNNTLINFGCFGIAIRDADNFSIYNNTFKQDTNFLLNVMGNNNFNCMNEPLTGIFIFQLFKTYLPQNTIPSSTYDNITYHKSNNIYLNNNLFYGINVPLRTQGTTNLTHDITNYWFRSWQFPYLLDIDNFYISNSFDYVFGINESGNINYNLKQGVDGNYMIEYSLFKEYSYFKNINDTQTYQLNIYNLTNALIYNTNGSVYGSKNINDNDNNINITIPPNNATYVLDNYKVNESETRANNPISFTTKTTTNKVINSTLKDPINTTLVLNVAQCGDISIKLNNKEQSFTCSEQIATISLAQIDPGDNQITITYHTSGLYVDSVCSSGLQSIADISGWLAIIIVIILTGYVIILIKTEGAENLLTNTPKEILAIITIGLMTAIGIILLARMFC